MKTNRDQYENYFKEHYNATFSAADTDMQSKFLFSQLLFIDKKINLSKYKNKKVLEIGSGLGAIANILLKEYEFEHYEGIELDGAMAEFTNESIGGYFRNESVDDLRKYVGRKYDLIFAFEVMEHLADPIESMSIIKSLLTDDGIFIATSPYPFKKNVLADKTHLFVLHPESWKVLLRKNNFKNIKAYPMSHLPYIWRINKRFNFRIPFYVAFRHFISTTMFIVS